MNTHWKPDDPKLPRLDLLARLSISARMMEQWVLVHAQVPEKLNPAAAFILARMSQRDEPISPRQLRLMGFYVGTNVSYNISQLMREGYIISSVISTDRRTRRLTLTDQGRELGLRVAMDIKYVEEHLAAHFSVDQFKPIYDFLDQTQSVVVMGGAESSATTTQTA